MKLEPQDLLGDDAHYFAFSGINSPNFPETVELNGQK